MKLNDQVYLLGIRHHGPGSASNLKRALAEIRPDAILLEGAQELQDSWQLAGAEGMEPPVAQLIYDPKDPTTAVFYPWGLFSPEWQAMHYALAENIPVRMMDLPIGIDLALRRQEMERQAAAEEAQEDESEDDEPEQERPQIIAPLEQLAQAAGFEDGEEWWEITVEHQRSGIEVFDAIAEAMTVLRNASMQPIEQRNLLREAWMRKSLRAARKEFQRIAVVCGAWHISALAAKVAVKEDNALLKGLEKRKVAVAWIPYTYARFSQASGYRAGIQSPGWYEHLFRLHEAGSDTGTLIIEWMIRIAQLLRQEGFDCSSAHVIDSVRLATNLAQLRGQPIAGLNETLEAARAVMTNGHNGPLNIIRQRLIISDRLGKLPKGIPKLPLEQDLDASIKRLRLKKQPSSEQLTLDLRKEIGLGRSLLLHRLVFLDIRWGTPDGGGGLGTFKEYWHIAWQPEFAVALIDASRYGNTIEEAASKRMMENIAAEQSVTGIAASLEIIQLANLAQALPATVAKLKSLAALSSDLQDLMNALLSLVQISRYGSVRATSAEALTQVIDGIVIRVTNGLASACIQLDEDAAYRMLSCIDKTHSAIGILESADYLERWQQALGWVFDNDNAHPVVHGRCTRMLYDLKQFSSEQLGQAFRLQTSSGNDITHSAAWLEGLLLHGAILLLHDDHLFQVVDAWIGDLEEEDFIRALPLMRRAFSTFSAMELSQIADRVEFGAATTVDGATVHDQALACKALPLLTRMLGLEEVTT